MVSERDDAREYTSQFFTHSELAALRRESVRQRRDDFMESIEGHSNTLKALEEAQQILEDQLEDANTEIDRLRSELDKAAIEAEEANYLRKEAERARRQLEETLYRIQEGADARSLTDLRDERMRRRRRTLLGIDEITRVPFLKGLVVGLLLGAMFAIAILEFFAMTRGAGEIFSILF